MYEKEETVDNLYGSLRPEMTGYRRVAEASYGDFARKVGDAPSHLDWRAKFIFDRPTVHFDKTEAGPGSDQRSQAEADYSFHAYQQEFMDGI